MIWRGRSRLPHGQKLCETIERSRKLVRDLGWSGIEPTLRGLDEAAKMAVKAGFHHLQVHAAHGYLFSLLVDYRINKNASEVLAWLADWARRHAAAGIETSIRISLRTGDLEFDALGGNLFHAQIAGLPFDFVDVSSGFYDINKQLIYPGRPDTLQARRAETIALARCFRSRSRQVFRWWWPAANKKRMHEPPDGSDGYRADKRPHDLTTG